MVEPLNLERIVIPAAYHARNAVALLAESRFLSDKAGFRMKRGDEQPETRNQKLEIRDQKLFISP